jgi:hypothetical protein
MMVRYQFNQRVETGTINFQLFHDGTVLAEQTHEYHPGGAGNAPEPIRTPHLSVPSGVPHGGYTILATHPKASGFSPVFAIAPIGEGGPGTPTAWRIHGITPGHMPLSWPRGSTHPMVWRIDGDYPDEREFIVQLKRGGRTVLTIPSDGAVWQRGLCFRLSCGLSIRIISDVQPVSHQQ